MYDNAIPTMKYSIFSVLTLSVLLTFSACTPAAPAPTAGTGDLTGFDLTDIPGSSIKHARQLDPAGQLVHEGYVLDDKRTGQWVEYSNEGYIVSISNYVNGLMEGPAMKLSYRGQVEERSKYHLGIPEGEQIVYKYGKILKTSNYTNGKLEGVVKAYDEKTFKLRQEIEYKNGLQHGFFRNYDENGVVNLEYEYKNGEKLSGGIVEKK